MKSNIRNLNQHRKDYLYDPKPFRKTNQAKPLSRIAWFVFGFSTAWVYITYL